MNRVVLHEGLIAGNWDALQSWYWEARSLDVSQDLWSAKTFQACCGTSDIDYMSSLLSSIASKDVADWLIGRSSKLLESFRRRGMTVHRAAFTNQRLCGKYNEIVSFNDSHTVRERIPLVPYRYLWSYILSGFEPWLPYRTPNLLWSITQRRHAGQMQRTNIFSVDILTICRLLSEAAPSTLRHIFSHECAILSVSAMPTRASGDILLELELPEIGMPMQVRNVRSQEPNRITKIHPLAVSFWRGAGSALSKAMDPTYTFRPESEDLGIISEIRNSLQIQSS